MIRRILEIPDPGLREPCAPVAEITPDLVRLAGDMFDTMRANAGVGLAAPQVGVHARLFVLETPPEDDDPLSGRQFVLINPQVELTGARKEMVEGCLSLPGFRAMVNRAEGVTVAFTQLDGARVSRWTRAGYSRKRCSTRSITSTACSSSTISSRCWTWRRFLRRFWTGPRKRKPKPRRLPR